MAYSANGICSEDNKIEKLSGFLATYVVLVINEPAWSHYVSETVCLIYVRFIAFIDPHNQKIRYIWIYFVADFYGIKEKISLLFHAIYQPWLDYIDLEQRSESRMSLGIQVND